jgi:hypothetical protein
MTSLTTCHNCWIKGDCRNCQYKSNLEIELHNTEQAENNIKYFLVILIIACLLGV